MILNGTLAVPPGELLLEDARDLWGWMNATGRTYPAGKWVADLVSEQEGATFAALM